MTQRCDGEIISLTGIEVLGGATVTLVERLDNHTPHSWYTIASQ